MNVRFQVSRISSSRALLAASVLAIAACGDDPTTGSGTPCESQFDCPDPIGQTCNLITGLCEQRPTADAGDDASEPDTDTPDTTPDTTPPTDTEDDTDSGTPDTDTGTETDTDTGGPDVRPDGDDDTSDGGPDVPLPDVVDPPPPSINPWIAFRVEPVLPVETPISGLYQYVGLIQSDGTTRTRIARRAFDGEFEAPGSTVGELAPEDAVVGSIAWSRDGQRLAYVRQNREDGLLESQAAGVRCGTLERIPHLRILDFDTGEDSMVIVFERTGDGADDLDALEAIQDITWHPDGTRMAILGRQAHRNGCIANFGDASGTSFLFYVDLATGEATRIAAAGERVVSPRFSPDGSRLFYSKGAGVDVSQIYSVSTTGALNETPITAILPFTGDFSLSFDGSRIAAELNVGGAVGQVSIFEVGDGSSRVVGEREDGTPAFLPDGTRLAIISTIPRPRPSAGPGAPEKDIYIVNASTGATVRALRITDTVTRFFGVPVPAPIDASEIDLTDFTVSP
jgi:hypothetical protein